MSEVERYWIDPSRLVQESWHQDDTCVVKDWAYDRAVAERDALQQRLTAADERADDLSKAATKALDVLRSLLKVNACGVHYAAAQMACHQLSTALKSGNP